MKASLRKLSLMLPIIGLVACGGGSDKVATNLETNDDGQSGLVNGGLSSLQIDATDYDTYRYFSFDTGTVLDISDEQAQSSVAWHLAFRRDSIKLNGGASGVGGVAGALVAAQDDFYIDAEADVNVFLNATFESEVEHLAATYNAPSDLQADVLITNLQGSGAVVGSSIDGGWYWYDFTNHQLSLNDSHGWLLRAGEGDSYARFRATQFDYQVGNDNDSDNFLAVTFEFDTQSTDADAFDGSAEFVTQIPAAGGEVCFDFNSESIVTCNGLLWDLKVGIDGRDFFLRANGGVSGEGSGAASRIFEWQGELADYASAFTDSYFYSADSTGGLFSDNSWYAYNLDGTHKLHPNYRVYWIDSDSADEAADKYLLQISGYYNDEGGESGYPNIRWMKVD